jgi:ABC-type sugar transport system ATPase subunit
VASVTLENVEKYYGDIKAVDNFSLQVRDGEFLVLLGPSGCGKTTALRMIAGLETISGGRICIADQIVNDLHPADRDVAMVFQSYALYPHMNVYKNLAYGLRRRKTPKAEIKQRVNETARLLGIDGLLTRLPAQLSGGQRQRVALGRAIVRHPAVFLMDEPLSNLDAQLRVQMRAELMRLHQRLGVTTIYVTHDQVEAMTMGQRIVVMSEGKVQQVGPPLDLYGRPQTLFVAGFLGAPQMNRVEGQITQARDQPTFTGGDLEFRWPASLRPPKTELIAIGLRPQHMYVSTGAESEQRDVLVGRGRIELLEHLGSQSFAFVTVGSTSLVAEVEPHVPHAAGDPVDLMIAPANIHVFDAATGRRIEVDTGVRVPA